MKYCSLIFFVPLFFIQCKNVGKTNETDLFKEEKKRVLKLAEEYGKLKPVTVADAVCERSAGGIHDFYSEGDYWWPDPENPEGPYIRKDGLTNPENFTAHRKAMIRFSQISGALASAYLATGDDIYVKQLLPHLKAWFIDPATLMNPNLLYGQAISGRVTGRGIGIIDTIHLIEVAQALKAVEGSGLISDLDINRIKNWFSAYLKWITTHPYGIAERDNGNNHSVCWAMQVAVFADLVDNAKLKAYSKKMYKEVLLPSQMDDKGAFPLELKRTKPYGYSLFTLDAMSVICQTLSTPGDDLFAYTTDEGKNLALGLEFIYPYIKEKNTWPYKKDVMYWDEWPVRHPFLLFGGLAFQNASYIQTWRSLDAGFTNPEVIRNMPIRYPMLWVDLQNQ